MTLPPEEIEKLGLERSVAQFFFEVGYGAAFAEAMVRNDLKPPFELTDALIERAWEVAGEAHEDPQEFDHYLALANASRDEALLSEIERLREENERLREGLAPFALAAEDLDEKHGDHGSLYEAPATLDLTAGHLRAARRLTEGQG